LRGECLGLLELVGGRGAVQRRVRGDALVDLERLLVLDLVRVQLQRFLEAVDGLAVPVAVEITEAEVIDRLFVLRVELERALERADGALELALVVEDRAEKEVRLRQLLDLDRLLQELLRAEQLPLARVNRAERKVREKRLLRDLDGAAQPALGTLEVLLLVQED